MTSSSKCCPPTSRVARHCAIAVAAILAGACNQVFGLDPVAERTGAAVDAAVDAPVCTPVAATDVPGEVAVDGMFARGLASAAMIGTTVVLVGSNDLRSNDGAMARTTFPLGAAQPWLTRAIGGAQNDQLWTVAASDDALLIGGMTRSFQNSGNDEGLLLLLLTTDGTLTSHRLRAGTAIQVRATAAAANGDWWVAGPVGATNGFVARLDHGNTTASAGTSFTVDGSQPMPRQIVESPDDSAAPFVIGQLGGGTSTGLVARVDTDPGDGDRSWAVTVSVELFDAAWFDGSLWVVGNAGADGSLLRFDSNGALLESWRVPLRPLHRIGRRDATTWLGGANSDGVFVATMSGDCVTGTELAGLTAAGPLPAPLPLVLTATPPFVAGRVGTVARVIPLGEDATASCGVPFATTRVPDTVAVSQGSYAAGAPLQLFNEPVGALTPPANLTNLTTTCP